MEYLSDGISESLINSLSQLPGIKVIARNSAFKYKGTDVDLKEVAKALGVEAILTGRVIQRGENLAISVELVNASDKTQIYANVQNAANTRPPDTGGQNTNNTLYDVVGRMFRVGVRFNN